MTHQDARDLIHAIYYLSVCVSIIAIAVWWKR